jgi:hypothetical protein
MEFDKLRGVRDRIEGWLAPLNVQSGVPTYIPKNKKPVNRPLTQAEIAEEAADHHEESEVFEVEDTAPQNEMRANRFPGLCGGLALQHEAVLLQQKHDLQ